MKKLVLLLLLLIVFLYYQLYQIIDINYISEASGNLKAYNSQNTLMLHENYNVEYMPHLNIKGVVDNIYNDKIIIKLSENSKDFLLTQYIELENNELLTKLQKNQNVFVMLKNIQIRNNILEFTNVSLYTPIDINLENVSHNTLIVRNDFGGFMKLEGSTFFYNDNVYFLENELVDKYREDLFYDNVETGILLTETLKHSLIPVIYNMINPQETMFNIIIQFYNN